MNTKGLIPEVLNWFQHPFDSETQGVNSPLNWVLFFGLAAILAWMWSWIVNEGIIS
jgi:hypothetical protein